MLIASDYGSLGVAIYIIGPIVTAAFLILVVRFAGVGFGLSKFWIFLILGIAAAVLLLGLLRP